MPNEIFSLHLSSTAISIYGYLLSQEDRKTYQCLASYRMIGETIGKSLNTVRKYVMELEERGLIRTERTTIITQDGRRQNGCLRYTILPIQIAIDQFYERQFSKAELALEQQRLQQRKAVHERKASVDHAGAQVRAATVSRRATPCEPLCGALKQTEGTCPTQGVDGEFEALLDEERRTKEQAG